MKNEPICPFCGKVLDGLRKIASKGLWRGVCFSCDQIIWTQDRGQYEARMKAFRARVTRRGKPGLPWSSSLGSRTVANVKKAFNPSSRSK